MILYLVSLRGRHRFSPTRHRRRNGTRSRNGNPGRIARLRPTPRRLHLLCELQQRDDRIYKHVHVFVESREHVVRRIASRHGLIRRSTGDSRLALRADRLRLVRRLVRLRRRSSHRRRTTDASHARSPISRDHATGDGVVPDERYRAARHAIG